MAPHLAADLRRQYLHIQRFAYVGVHARFQAGFHVVGKNVGGHGDNGDAALRRAMLEGADGAGGLQAVHLGHHHVH